MTVRIRIGTDTAALEKNLIVRDNGYETEFTYAGTVFKTLIRYQDKSQVMPKDHATYLLKEVYHKNSESWIDAEIILDSGSSVAIISTFRK
ncbi:hypothetical protein CPC16_004442 [Podila verticillata]|nr:hypothetical protein CPC16_004442 [Podila verticillata]